jgi:endoribonuclease Dicer
MDDVAESFVYVPSKNTFFFVSDIIREKNGFCIYKDTTSHFEHYLDMFDFRLLYPEQPLLKAKQLFCLDNLLRKKGHAESREKEEHFVELPPEICQLKIIGFSKEIGSSLSLLPSIMRRLESLLVAIELKNRLASSFPEGSQVSTYRVLEALTTEKCSEHFSLERLEILGVAFLKFAVGRHLFLQHDALDEGQLTRRRSNLVNNSNLYKLATASNLQVYIRDQSFEPSQFFVLGRRCPTTCTEETKSQIHSPEENSNTEKEDIKNTEINCNKNHHWLHKKTIADIVEALVGAFLVDSGFKASIAFLKWIGIKVDFNASQVHKLCSASSIFVPIASSNGDNGTTCRMDILALEKLLGYQFVHKGLLVQAFVHPSYNNHWGGCYQRLEFLGDAVLDYIITSYLYSSYPNLKPGQLTDLRSISVNNNSFADIAVDRSFHNFIICESTSLCDSMNKYVNFLVNSESDKNLLETPCPKALGDLVESCVGAILLDSGFDLRRVWKIVLSFFKRILRFSRLYINPNRELLELCQTHGLDVEVTAVKKGGVFTVDTKVIGKNVFSNASAINVNKETAKRMAAKQLSTYLKAKGYKSKAKSLEEVLRTSIKAEEKLIGYDEIPTEAIAPSTTVCSDDSETKEASRSNHEPPKSQRSSYIELKKFKNRNIKVKTEPSDLETQESQTTEIVDSNSENGNAQNSGQYSNVHKENKASGPNKATTAKSRLNELCSVNYWKPPVYEVWKESGPCHLKEFIMKVTVRIEEGENTILEARGNPRQKKKDASDEAAEGALWYLEHQGYSLDS